MWLAIQPRADQPLLDAAEAMAPSLREAYFNEKEKAIYEDAKTYEGRYAEEAARLTGVEVRSRWQDATVDDNAVRRMSSFQQSYNEMIKGERFVMQETRSRARERLRLGRIARQAGHQKIGTCPHRVRQFIH